MSFLSQTSILYAVVGAAVAMAIYLAGPSDNSAERWFRLLSAIPFWPIYLPILLARPDNEVRESSSNGGTAQDEMAVAIAQADAELEAALGSLDGWAEDVLAREKSRIHDLRSAWTAQAERLRAMDRLLALPEQVEPEVETSPKESQPSAVGERLRRSLQARRKNIQRLRHVRQRGYDDLMGTLAWVRELVSMIHLAKFTGQPAARAEELIAQIADVVEGISENTWKSEDYSEAK